MCGGSGTRVWPESRESLPKQFIPLIGDRSTFQSIIGVVGDAEVFDRPVVITNFDYRFRVAEQLKEIGAEATILLEPERRDSAAAVGAAAAWAAARDPKTIVAILAADHVFQNEKRFAQLCAAGGRRGGGGRDRHLRREAGSSGDRLRIHPSRRTARLTIRRSAASSGSSKSRTRSAAKTFIEAGYLWNSGNFVFRADVMLEELKRFRAEDRRGHRRGRRPRQGRSRIPRSRPRRLRPGAAHLDRLCGHGANAPRGGAGGRRRLVGRRPVVDRLAAEPAGRRRQQPARPGGGDRFVERARPLGRASGRGDRPATT